MIKSTFPRTGSAALANLSTIALLVVMTVGSSPAFAQTADPSFEVFRIRCQIDIDTDPVTGLPVPKVQIQAKARADLLDGQSVVISVANFTDPMVPPPAPITAVFSLGSASADWDTFPDGLNPAVMWVDGAFVVHDDEIIVNATANGQNVSAIGKCAAKKSSQFKQQTKKKCKLKDFNRNKCKPGDILPDGTIMP